MKTPTDKQAAKLRPLADGYAILAPRRGEWVGLMRSGWVERIDDSSPRGGLLPPLRITPEGRAALSLAPDPTEPEEGTCTSTTSEKTSRPPVVSGLKSLASVSTFSGSISPPLAVVPLRSSSVSVAPSPSTVPTSHLSALVPTADDVADEIEEAWKEAEHRKAARAPRGRSFGSTMRCPACKLFVSNGRLCSCGYTPGIGWAA